MRNLTKNDLTKEQRIKIARLAKIELSKQSFHDYCQFVHQGAWRTAPHLHLICDTLQQVLDGKIKRLMIFAPPRHSKSMTVTETFPSYFLGKFPDKRIIELSYGSDLAERFGKLNRRKIQDFGKEIFDVEISPEKSSVTNWDIKNHSGGMLSAGIGAGVTGHGGNLILVDDPIKNYAEAISTAYSERVWNEYRYTVSTRQQGDSVIIIILTRWHEKDLAGRLLDPNECDVEDWKILSLPAICESENDLLNRSIGEALWDDPSHEYSFPIKKLERQKKTVGSQAWNSLYQQRPSPPEGTMFKRHYWKFYDKDLKIDEMEFLIQSWDCTFKDAETSNYVVGQIWGKKGANRYLIDQVRAKMDIVATMAAIENLTAKYPDACYKLIEDKANGSAIITMLRNKIEGIIPIEPQGGKVVRANAIIPLVEAGNVWLPCPAIAPWINDFVEECASFPNGKFDDQVDGMSQSLSHQTMRNQNLIYSQNL